ncbi:hypothetical protein [Candidatus Sororendozoicomonas aggregata]|uniref:hypothetical protein n=1 Tax=Candidatus Sororendozoicomonas aggregata TaxID=3073239 RepID=UPI002ED3FA4C
MTLEHYKKVEAALERRQSDLTVIIDQAHKAHPIGTIILNIRNCDTVGITNIYWTWVHRRHRQFYRRSRGSYQWVTVRYHERVKDSAEILNQCGFLLHAIHFSDKSIPCDCINFTCFRALISGARKNGVSETADQGQRFSQRANKRANRRRTLITSPAYLLRIQSRTVQWRYPEWGVLS